MQCAHAHGLLLILPVQYKKYTHAVHACNGQTSLRGNVTVMDSTSVRLARRARARRHHERYARAAKTRRKHEDFCPESRTNVPKLPRLSGSQCLVTAKEGQSCKYKHAQVQCGGKGSHQQQFSGSASKCGCGGVRTVKTLCGHSSDTALTTAQRRRHGGSHTREMAPIKPAPNEACMPSPSFSWMVREKTKGLNLSEELLTGVKEMSSQLRIVNWLWDGGKMADHSTAASSNLVLVRRNSPNWFDIPHLTAPPEGQLTPLSANSDLKSDYELELMEIM